jgi:hypothetical protein
MAKFIGGKYKDRKSLFQMWNDPKNKRISTIVVRGSRKILLLVNPLFRGYKKRRIVMKIKMQGQCLGVESYTNDKGTTYLSANFAEKGNGKLFKFGCNKVVIPDEAIQVACDIELDVLAENKFGKLFIDIQDARFVPLNSKK